MTHLAKLRLQLWCIFLVIAGLSVGVTSFPAVHHHELIGRVITFDLAIIGGLGTLLVGTLLMVSRAEANVKQNLETIAEERKEARIAAELSAFEFLSILVQSSAEGKYVPPLVVEYAIHHLARKCYMLDQEAEHTSRVYGRNDPLYLETNERFKAAVKAYDGVVDFCSEHYRRVKKGSTWHVDLPTDLQPIKNASPTGASKEAPRVGRIIT